jgi:YHS domain-containing protein
METQTAWDPVSRHAVALTGSPISTIYQGRAYYFESRDNRDAFESSPEKYVAGLPGAGQAIGSEAPYADRPRRRGGC